MDKPTPAASRDEQGRFDASTGFLSGYWQAWATLPRCSVCGRRIWSGERIVQTRPSRERQPEYRHAGCEEVTP